MKRLLCIAMVVLLMVSTAAYAESSGQQAQTFTQDTTEERLVRMIPVFDSLAHNMVLDSEAAYDASSPQFVWTQLYLCAANWGFANALVKQEEGRLIVPIWVMEEYAAASFYGMDGLPDKPADMAEISFDAVSNAYRVQMPDAAQTYVMVERFATGADGATLAGVGIYQLANAQRLGGLFVQMADSIYRDALSGASFPYGVKSAQLESDEDFAGLLVTDCQLRYVPDDVSPTVTMAPTQTPAPTASTAPIATSTPAASEYPKLSMGSRGEAVSDLQSRLNELGYNSGSSDGIFGSGTKQAVRYFQDAIGVTQNGIATDSLQQRLYASSAPEFVKYVTLKKGSGGIRVEKLQARLRELGYLAEPADGEFGSRTKEAVTLFQKKANLKSDGIAGERTLKALGKKDAPQCNEYITLKKGDTGSRVKEMQERLKKLNFLTKAVSGTYDNDTAEALQEK